MKKRWVFIILLIVFLIPIGIWGFYTAKHAYHLYQSRQEVKSIINGGYENLSPAYALDLIHSVDQDLNVLDRNLAFIYPVSPWFGSTTAQLEPAIKYLKSMVSYALLFEPKLAVLLENGIDNQVEMSVLLEELLNDDLFLKQVVSSAQAIAEYDQKLNIDKLPTRFQDDFTLIEKANPFIALSAQIMPLLPEIIGLNEPADYLLLALNNDELRGGGGFITAIGSLTVKNLSNIDFTVRDSYQIDDLTKTYPIPPPPLVNYMQAQMWLPRDGNWAADFPGGAQIVQSLVNISDNQETQGVVAFDQEAVQQIMSVLGPLQVDPTQNIWVDQNNVVQFMQESWASDADQKDWWANRKDFIGLLGKLILETVMDSRDYKLFIQIGKTAAGLMESGHLMVYFNDEVLQKAIHELKLDGSILYQGGDLVYWVDSNIGFNKMDQVITRKLIYQVDLSDIHNLTAEITMLFENPIKNPVACVHEASYGQDIAYQNMMERCYWDYWRFYRTPGSELSNAELAAVPGDWLLSGQDWSGELDQDWAFNNVPETGGLMVMATNTDQRIKIGYSLPLEVLKFDDGTIRYQLQLYKQLGLVELPVEVHITAPDGFQFADFPDLITVNGNSAIWNMSLTKTLTQLDVKFER